MHNEVELGVQRFDYRSKDLYTDTIQRHHLQFVESALHLHPLAALGRPDIFDSNNDRIADNYRIQKDETR